MVAVDTIWQLLQESGLVAADKIPSLKTKFGEDHAEKQEVTARTLLKWLVRRKRITLYQAKILSAGQPGPFIYSDYHIYEKTAAGPLANSFRALHRPSNHAVRLCFFPGNDVRQGETWQIAMSLAEKASRIDSPFVVRLFEAEGTDEHRFLVIDDRPGKALSDKLPAKGRLPWITACQAVEQLALGISQLHRQELVHGNLSPASVWIRRSGTAQLLWPIPGAAAAKIGSGESTADYLPPGETGQPTQRTDLYSIGCLLYRLVTGKPPALKDQPVSDRTAQINRLMEKCKKYESPDNLNRLIGHLLMADINDDVADIEAVHDQLKDILGSNSIAKDVENTPETLEAYEKSLHQKRRSAEFFDQLESMAGGSDSHANPSFDFAEIDKKPARSLVENRAERAAISRSRSMLIWLIGGGLVVISVIVGILLGGGNEKTPRTANDHGAGRTSRNDLNDTRNTLVDLQPSGQGNVVQELIEDDGMTPWESPTNGLPIEVAWLPPAPDYLIAARPRDLVSKTQGQLFLQSFGQDLERRREAWLDELGMELHQIERLTISFHTNADRQYSNFYVVHLSEPVKVAEILKSLGDPASVTDEETSRTFYQRGELAFRLDNRTGQAQAQTIAFGPTGLIKESLARGGAAALSPAMEKLIRRSDRERDLSLVFLPNMLSGDESLWLFSGSLAGLRRPLQLFFDERVVAVMLSAHFDEGNYIELMAQRTLDIRADELVRLLNIRLQKTRDELGSLVDRIPRHPYWDAVRTRYDKMIQELYRNTRVGVENGEVIANCWLPPMALHNLVASSELVMASSGAASAPVVELAQPPQSLDELLAKRRSLSVTSQPDLVNLLSDLMAEVNDDHPTMPFDFQIKLMGPDLSTEGITQNQRLPDLVLQDIPLAEILTEIVYKANPDKNATGPDDERCKLVWLIADDPDTAGRRIILVTTRAAAAQNGYGLPAVFQSE